MNGTSGRSTEASSPAGPALSDWPQTLRSFAGIVRQIETLHQAGRLHGSISVDSLEQDAEGRLVLGPPPPAITLGGQFWDPARCPPGILADDLIDVPTRIADAAAMLAGQAPGVDPRWIDLYQLGGVLYQLLTGRPILEYLYTARGKGRVPRAVRPILEGLLGFDPGRRFASCGEVLSAIEAALARQAQTPPTQVQNELPERLGQYRLLEYIGRGGMGEVYRGYEETLDREVAIKVLPRELADQPEFVQRFRSEAIAAAHVAHPNVIPIYSVGKDAGRHYFAMQYVQGESLADRLRRCGRLPLDEALDLASQILQGLDAAHRCGIIHRDLKPGNILIEQATNRVLLVDFGLSRRLTAGGQCLDQDLFLGTVEYLAPEQIRGDPADQRSDLYAFGAVLYQMLSGRGPRRADSPTGALVEAAFGGPLALNPAEDELPDAVCRLISRLTARNPDQRYATSAEALAELTAIRKRLATTKGRVKKAMASQGGPRRWARREWLVAALLAAGVGCLAWVGLRRGLPGSPGPANPQADALLPPTLPAGQWIDLVPEITPDRDSVAGVWHMEGGVLRAQGEPFSRLLLPLCVSGAYDLNVQFTRYPAGEAQGNVEVFLPVGMATCALSLSGSSEVPGRPDRVHGLSRVRGYTPGEDSGGANPTARFPGTLENGHTYHLAIGVRPEGPAQVRIQARLDGQTVVDWSGPPEHLDLHPSWRLSEPLRPGLGAASNPVAFSAIRFRLVSGVAWRPASWFRQIPSVVRPGGDRAIVLCVPAAEIHGHVLRETAPGVLGFWSDEREWVSWTFLAEPQTRYRLELRYSCHEPCEGSTYTVTIRGPQGAQIVARGTVTSTGQYWENYRTVPLGTWQSGEAGPYTLELKPAVKPGEAVMNLQWMRLVPLGGEAAALSRD